MDLRTRTTLLCGALALAIAVSILLRGGRRKLVHLVFAGFAADMGVWYLVQSFYGMFQTSVWALRFTALLAVLLPLFAINLFETIVPHRPTDRRVLLRVAGALFVPIFVLVLTQQHHAGFVRAAVFLYVFGLIAAGLWSLAERGERSGSRATKNRVRFLVIIGSLAASFSLADFLWFIGAELPPVGAVLSIVFLFVLAESLRRERLVDLYEMVGRLVVSTALAFLLSGIFYVFITYIGSFKTVYLNGVLAAIVILLLFEPLRAKVEQKIHGLIFRERADLYEAVAQARRRLVHVLEVDELYEVVTTALETSHRATAAALYLYDPTGTGLELGCGFGSDLPQRIEVATVRALLDRVAKGPVVLDKLQRDLVELKGTGERAKVDEAEAVLASAGVLGPLRGGVVIAVRAEDRDITGLLAASDDRVGNDYSDDETMLFETLATQIGVVIQNSLVYRRMQERDRLAAIGQMAARLAHEVKNPLGAIKGAAQLLGDPAPGTALDPTTREFIGIILEEVDRLDRVVGTVLDYAQPSRGNPAPVDPNAVVRRTIQILQSDREDDVQIQLGLAEDLPRVRIDPEQLRQVLMNLVKNAFHAMNGRGTVAVATRRRSPGRALAGGAVPWVELSVTDSGHGISQKVLKNLFVPFFTTKNQGTGLGLAICHRIVNEAGGTIEVRTHEGSGTTFAVLLPGSTDALAASEVGAAKGGPLAGVPSTRPTTPVTPPVQAVPKLPLPAR